MSPGAVLARPSHAVIVIPGCIHHHLTRNRGDRSQCAELDLPDIGEAWVRNLQPSAVGGPDLPYVEESWSFRKGRNGKEEKKKLPLLQVFSHATCWHPTLASHLTLSFPCPSPSLTPPSITSPNMVGHLAAPVKGCQSICHPFWLPFRLPTLPQTGSSRSYRYRRYRCRCRDPARNRK